MKIWFCLIMLLPLCSQGQSELIIGHPTLGGYDFYVGNLHLQSEAFFSTSSRELDLNGNGTPDIRFNHYSSLGGFYPPVSRYYVETFEEFEIIFDPAYPGTHAVWDTTINDYVTEPTTYVAARPFFMNDTIWSNDTTKTGSTNLTYSQSDPMTYQNIADFGILTSNPTYLGFIRSTPEGQYIYVIPVGFSGGFTIYNGYTNDPVYNKMIVYPNPCEDNLRVYGDVESVSIYSQSGKPLFTNLDLEGSQFNIDVSSLSQGIYIVRGVSPAGQVTIERFIKL